MKGLRAHRALTAHLGSPALAHPDARTAASTVSASLVRPTLRPHADSVLNSPGSSGPTRLVLSFLALFSAAMMLLDRADPASLAGARRLPALDAAPDMVAAWSRIRAIVSCGRTMIMTPWPFLGADLEIGGGQAHGALLGLEQHIGEDRQGLPGLDGLRTAPAPPSARSPVSASASSGGLGSWRGRRR